MEKQISFSDFPIRSEELLAIQNDISSIQDGLDKVVNDNISRNIFLNQASRNFFDFIQKLHQRGEVLQEYAKTLIERENELSIEQKKYNEDIFNLRIINVDLPAEEEKLADLREKCNDLSGKRKKVKEKIDLLKAKIQSMVTEHNSMSTQIDKIHLTITDNLYDDMGDTNVNIFIQVQNLRKEIEDLSRQIEVTHENIQNNEKRMKYLNDNIDSISSIKKSLKAIPEIQESISSISSKLKEIRLKQRDERVKSLQYSTELNQLCQQQDEVYENLEMQKSFNLKVPTFNSKVIESERQINDIKNDLQIQLQENRIKAQQNIEMENKAHEELEILDKKISKASAKYDLLESKVAEVEILLEDQNREKSKIKSLMDLNNIDNKNNNEKVKNALLNFNITNPSKFQHEDDEIYNEKKKLLDSYDIINKEITEINYQIGQIHFKIEYELMRQNVLDAENHRLHDFQEFTKNDEKRFKIYVTKEKERKFKNDNENENSVAQFISKRKADREEQIIRQKKDLSNLENIVSVKKSRTLIRSQKLSKIKREYEQSIQNLTKSNEKTEVISLSDLEDNSKIEKKMMKKNELLNAYIQKVSDTFQSQTRFWEIFDKKNDDEIRESLNNWAVQIDQANRKLKTLNKQSVSKSSIKKQQSRQSSKTEVSTYLENIDRNTFSYSDL